jgi:hypothetical protein
MTTQINPVFEAELRDKDLPIAPGIGNFESDGIGTGT